MTNIGAAASRAELEVIGRRFAGMPESGMQRHFALPFKATWFLQIQLTNASALSTKQGELIRWVVHR